MEKTTLTAKSLFYLAVFLISVFIQNALALDKGIYLTQNTLENTQKLNYLINRAKETGINAFVIDLDRINNRYKDNIAIVKNSGIKYVARIVVFPHGGTDQEVLSRGYWENRYKLVKYAMDSGADAIQLDYIRYNTKRAPLPQYTQNIKEVVAWFKQKTAAYNVPLQIDVFGEVAFGPSKHIGQDLKAFAGHVDDVNPMVYPSHFAPYQSHSQNPYKTIHSSLTALHEQFDHQTPFKVHAYIEMSNYHYRTAPGGAQNYIHQQIKAVEDSNVSGWYAWSAGNKYDNLFKVLSTRQVK